MQERLLLRYIERERMQATKFLLAFCGVAQFDIIIVTTSLHKERCHFCPSLVVQFSIADCTLRAHYYPWCISTFWYIVVRQFPLYLSTTNFCNEFIIDSHCQRVSFHHYRVFIAIGSCLFDFVTLHFSLCFLCNLFEKFQNLLLLRGGFNSSKLNSRMSFCQKCFHYSRTKVRGSKTIKFYH